jgi:hypothetical protein
MNQGTNWLLLMKKKKGQKSRASVPLRTHKRGPSPAGEQNQTRTRFLGHLRRRNIEEDKAHVVDRIRRGPQFSGHSSQEQTREVAVMFYNR